MIRRHGVTPVQWAAAQGLMKPDTDAGPLHPARRPSADPLAHAKDLDLIAEAGASVAHCPQPFARYGLAMDHVGRYRARGVTVGLGTDCAPHNLIEEMRLAIVAGRLMSEDIAASTRRRLRGGDLRRRHGARPRRSSARWRPAWRPTSCWSISPIR